MYLSMERREGKVIGLRTKTTIVPVHKKKRDKNECGITKEFAGELF